MLMHTTAAESQRAYALRGVFPFSMNPIDSAIHISKQGSVFVVSIL